MAREENFSVIVTDATPHADLLRDAGFSPTTESELWRLALSTAD